MTQYVYSEVTNSLKVTVIPTFLEDISFPKEHNYIWSYNIVLENLGKDTVQLLSRYWQIIDKFGQIQEVNGPGVVGQQPILKPGEAFEYTSHAQLRTSSGIMFGKYHMKSSENGNEFNIRVPTFSLDIPQEKINLN
ncbi:MAG: Co2+/Mg2+ efflux protein ApaG [Alphaproteobacteria bacterium]